MDLGSLRHRLIARPAPEGDWTKGPWFLDPAHAERLWAMRYEGAELEQAYAALSELYPADVCQSLLRKLEQVGQPADETDRAFREFRQLESLARFVRGLYEPHDIVSDILALGVDLASVLRATPPRKWLDRLKDPDSVRGTEFEVQVWANAMRSGVPIRRVPETKSRKPGIKTPDFAVEWNHWRFGVEAKSVETGEHDRVRFEHFPLIHPTPPSDREYHVSFAPEIQALAGSDTGREKYRKIVEDVQAALNEKKGELQDAGSPLGEYRIPGVGQIVIAERDPEFVGRSATVSYTSEASQEKKARRLLPAIRDAAAKFQTWPDRVGHIAVAIVDAPMDYNPGAVQEAVLKEIRDNQPTYRETDAVIWRRVALHLDPDSDPWKTHYYYACFVLRLPWCAVPAHQLAQFAGLLLASPHRFFVPPRLRDKPDPFPSVREKMMIVPAMLDFKRGR